MLQVIRLVEKTPGDKNRQAKWECQCECGKKKDVRSWPLVNGNTVSCGHARMYTARNRSKDYPRPVKADPEDRAHRRRMVRIFCSRRLDAGNKGVPFEIRFEDLPPVPKDCPVLGIPIRFSDRANDPNSPSLDRFLPALGYVKGNIGWISLRANMLKRDGTVEEITKLAEWMRVHTA